MSDTARLARCLTVLVFVCVLIPSLLFISNLAVVYKNFPHGTEFDKLTLVQFAERSGFVLRKDLKPRLQSAFESFPLSNGFIAAESCEICANDHNGCHRQLAKEAQRWMRHTFEEGPAWVPLKPLQPYLLQLGFARSYDDATLLKIIAYARMLHTPFASVDEACIKMFRYRCELLSLSQNLQVDVTTINFAYSRTPHYKPDFLPKRLAAARQACGLR